VPLGATRATRAHAGSASTTRVGLPGRRGYGACVARLRCDFFSEVLDLGTSMTVLLPERSHPRRWTRRQAGPATLYLLHGLSDDDTAWTRYTGLERYVEGLGLAVVMPQVHRSFYTDGVRGHRYWTFLSRELPERVRGFFRLSERREDTFVAGLSMGGYGALKWALREPDRFAAVASLSGALDVQRRQRDGGPVADPAMYERIFGDRAVAGSGDDLWWLLDRAAPARLPRIYLCCGTDDGVYPESVRFRDACRAKGIAVTADFGPGGHEWRYWDAKVREVLAWLPLGGT
jgi:putative tributyrin esterase